MLLEMVLLPIIIYLKMTGKEQLAFVSVLWFCFSFTAAVMCAVSTRSDWYFTQSVMKQGHDHFTYRYGFFSYAEYENDKLIKSFTYDDGVHNNRHKVTHN